ncbi:hypothetical protein AVEN_39897-1 [Araneus ventricosus]|uniref:Integrase catalytic domain-containing protein n=1 Tax=Araneus ventricosus TaxID=182803 RepID=A0A4Y2JQC2_ARAVE|nr:hypothetical protein AVEN_39897-1 [Araneus ventricosus]
MYPIGISADIEKAFLMLSVAPKDRDFLRFFYPCNDVEFIYRHCRIVFGVSSSPFLLNATIMHLLENCTEFYDVVQKLKCSFYVDNCLTGVHDVSEAENFIEMAKLIMFKGCFNLRGWESNVECRHASKHSGNTSVLGIIWNLDEDTLKCKIDFEILSCETKITKRFILSTVQKFYDPLGMLTPSTLLPKLILQDLWKSRFSWEEELPFAFTDRFSKWLNEMYSLKDVALPRFVNFNETSELHVFVDACKGAYSACVFVRSEVEGESKVRLIRAKNRMAPSKSLSIPRLELMACCIGARLVNSVIKAIDASSIKVTLWSDSTVALWWIKEYGDWSVFVANRVKEIRELTGSYSWRHVPGNMNIADLLSRGCTPQQMLNSKWWEDPSWLKENPESWPVSDIICQPKEVDIEKRKSKLLNMNLTEDTPPWYAERVSDYDRMIRVFAWVLRFVNNCKVVNGKCKDSELSQSEIEYSEKKLILLVQSYYLSDAKSSNFIETFLDNEDRVTDCAPFEIAGIDLAGPLYLKNEGKVWIVLFTCAVYRAIHLELVNSLSSDAFLLALRRFIARRGRPRTIYCDNGTNFRGASKDLSKLNWSKVLKETRTPKLFWKFIPPTAAWWGGWWERLVSTLKDLLKRTLGKSVLTSDELYIVICDCESIINCRPLTYVAENLEELVPLTPSMFLIENRSSNTGDIEQ